MAENLNVLAVACHPADAFDAVGGTIAKHADRGDHVTVAILTHGVKSHNWALMAREREREVPVTEDEVKAGIEVKENEIKKEGLAILGIEDARFLKYDDAFLQVSERIVLKLADLVREVRPHIVITHCPIEQSGVADQHALCGQMTLLALRRAKEVMPGEKRPPFRALRVYFEATGGTTSILDYARPPVPARPDRHRRCGCAEGEGHGQAKESVLRWRSREKGDGGPGFPVGGTREAAVRGGVPALRAPCPLASPGNRPGLREGEYASRGANPATGKDDRSIRP